MAQNTIIEKTIESLKSLLFNKDLLIDKIILFGSYVSGKINPESDIDYIVVSKSFRNKNIFEKFDLTKGINFSLTSTYELPFDILYYSDIEWENSLAVPINEAKKYGIVLYSDD